MRWSAVLLLLVFALAACGGSSPSPNAGSTPTTVPLSPSPSPTPSDTILPGPLVRTAPKPTSVCDGFRQFSRDLAHYPQDQVLLEADVAAMKKVALAQSNKIPQETFIDANALASYITSTYYQSEGSAKAAPILTMRSDCKGDIGVSTGGS